MIRIDWVCATGFLGSLFEAGGAAKIGVGGGGCDPIWVQTASESARSLSERPVISLSFVIGS